MPNKRFILYLLGIFITTIMLVVFLQYNSTRNIDELIEGNESLLGEYKLKSDVQNLLIDLGYITQANEKAFLENAVVDLNEVTTRRIKIAEELKHIQNLPIRDSTKKKYLNQLGMLVNQLLPVLDKELEQVYGYKNKPVNINKEKKEKFAQEIIKLANELNNTRNEHLAKLVENADNNGKQAKFWGGILAAVAATASVFTFWYISNKIKFQQQLIQHLNESEQKVREAATIKENFMANMSHEIRTPMNAILGFTHLLQKQSLDEKSKDFVSSIKSSGENLMTIINDVLDFSKIEAGMMRIDSNPFSLRGLLQSVETMFAARIEAKNLHFAVDVEHSIPDVLNGDAVRLTQIMVNLVNNAVKFTSSGSIDISVTAENKKEDAIEVSFSVRDTGIGIAPGKMETIFDRFQQADEDTTRKYGGTGLGLSIVKQLVELQNGSIRVVSLQDKGTEFIFTIAYRVTEEITEKNRLGYIPAGGMEIKEPHVKILVAEDNAMNQSLVKYLLTDWNFNFHIVNNGKEAVEALQQREYSLVLMDIQMPQMDGYKATEKIRNELHNNIPIIAMTAHAMAGEREKCLSYGMNEYISKPIREKELFKIIRDLLSINGPIDTITGEKNYDPHTNLEVLNLDYLKDLSGGNKQFEVSMLDQFLQQVPRELDALHHAFIKKNYAELKQIAHNMKTSVSFMGLTERLGVPLDYIENNAVIQNENTYLKEKIKEVNDICLQAFSEAEKYLKQAT